MPRTAFKRALITGASAGLGAEFARQLAAAGTGLVLTARRRDRLEELARELHERHGVAVEAVGADLSREDGLAALERLLAGDAGIDLLVNNAGFGGRTGFAGGEIGDHMNMVRVHVDAAVRLTRAALPGMIARGRGAVINIASVAAFSPFSGAMYSGTKAFLAMFSLNLQAELAEKGVVVQALCPGMTHTEFHEVAAIDKAIVPKPLWMTAEEVVHISLRKLGREVICIPGWKNKIIAFLMRCPLTAAGIRAVSRAKLVRGRAAGK